MQTKFFCDLYVSEGWEEKKLKLIKKLQKNKLQPSVYVITLSQGKQNHLEYYSSLLLKQHIFDNASLFINTSPLRTYLQDTVICSIALFTCFLICLE